MSLTNPNTPVSQQDLKDLYEQKILPYIGGAFGLVATGIDSANLYSTTEKIVGQWIDGKPLYQKTIAITSGMPSSGGRTEFNHNIENIDYIVSQRARIIYPDSMVGMECDSVYIDGPDSLSNTQIAMVAVNATKIILKNTKTLANTELYVTLQYTKTTDSAVESYGTDTTYSTDEHVVGSWIDGRPVYQKTIVSTQVPNNNYVQIPHGITNMDFCISFDGMILNEGHTAADTYAFVPLPRVSDNNANNFIQTQVTRTYVELYGRQTAHSNIFNRWIATIKYVKKVSS